MSEFTESILEHKLSNLTESGSSIMQLSTWIISHRRHFQVIGATFYKVLVRTDKDKTIIFLYLVHEIVQRSKNKHPEFIIEFGNLMKKILEYLVESDYLDIKSTTKIWDLIKLWRKNQIFDVNKQDDFETIWKRSIAVDKSTLKREKSCTTTTPKYLPEKRLKTSKLGLKLYCFLCQEDGHESNESCHTHAICQNCGIKGHIRNDCPKTIKKYTEGEKLNLMKNQNFRPKFEGKAHLNETHMEVSNNSNDDDDVIILKQEVGGTPIPIVTITLEDNEWKHKDKHEPTINLKSSKNEFTVNENEISRNSASVDPKSHKEKGNDEGLCGGMREGTTVGTRGGLCSEVEQFTCQQNLMCQEVNNNSTNHDSFIKGYTIASGIPLEENLGNLQYKNRKEYAQDNEDASEVTNSQHYNLINSCNRDSSSLVLNVNESELLSTNDNDSNKNNSQVSKDILLESGSKIPIIVDVFNKHQEETNTSIERRKIKENNEVNGFSNKCNGNSHPAEGDKEHLKVQIEQLKWDNNYVPPKTERMEPLNSSNFEINNKFTDNDDVIFMAEVAGHAVSEIQFENNRVNSNKKKINEEKEKGESTIKTDNSQHCDREDAQNVRDLNPVSYLNKLADCKNNVTIGVDLSQNLNEKEKELNWNESSIKIPSLMDISVKETDHNAFEYKNWPRKVLLFTILNVQYPISVDVMHKICSNAVVNVGIVLRIVTFERHALKCLVEFDTEKAAKQAKDSLHGTDIYKGSCSLDVQYARKSELNVSKNDERNRDYTTGFKQNNCGQMDDNIMAGTMNTRISQDRGNNVPEDRSYVVMVYSTTPEKINCNVLFNLFSQYGNVNRVVFMRKKKGHAMLEMEDPESAERAIRYLDRAKLFGCQIQLSVCRRYKTLANMKRTFKLPDGSGAIQDYRGHRNSNLSLLFNAPTKYLLFQNVPKMERSKLDRLFVDNGAPRPLRMKWFSAKYENSTSDMGLVEFASIEEACDALALVNHVEITSLQINHMLPSTLKLSFAPPTY